MSADNGIYIHKFSRGWKVCHAQAIENINYQPDKSGYNKKILKDYFQDSPLFKTEDEAWLYARKLAQEVIDEYGVLEYGICKV